MDREEQKHLEVFAKQIQIETLKAIEVIGVGHVGGSLSMAHCLAALYGKAMNIDPQNPQWDSRDWFILSKGHCGPALYAALALKGYFPMDELRTVNQAKTNLPSHCDRTKTVGIDMTTGSLGQGASSAAGIALGHKIDHRENYTYLVLGDGECQEGQVWEMALFAAQQKLNRLIAFVDDNKLQLDGFTDDINSIGDIAEKFAVFNWFTQRVNGHDVNAICNAIQQAKKQQDKPSMIVLDTVKGQGWKAIENTVKSHSLPVTHEDIEAVLKDLEAEIEEILKS